uniref:Uncharacterized protein n=1 Tax=Oryza brachyantha TaxID=4533 RepID=J3LKJ6_ORYBR
MSYEGGSIQEMHVQTVWPSKVSGDVWLMSTKKSQEDVVYPEIDPRLKIKVDDESKDLARSIELPRDMLDVEKELHKSGQPTKTNTARRRAAAQSLCHPPPKPKSRKKRGLTSRSSSSRTHICPSCSWT